MHSCSSSLSFVLVLAIISLQEYTTIYLPIPPLMYFVPFGAIINRLLWTNLWVAYGFIAFGCISNSAVAALEGRYMLGFSAYFLFPPLIVTNYTPSPGA